MLASYAWLTVGTAGAATPDAGTVSPSRDTFSWKGEHYQQGSFATAAGCESIDAGDARCDHVRLNVDASQAFYRKNPAAGARIRIAWGSSDDDFDLYVYDADTGDEVGASFQPETSFEQVFIPAASGSYDVLVVPYFVTESDYAGTARLVRRSGAVQPPKPRGPCTRTAARSMPNHEGHDHTDISQHRFKCRMRLVRFDSLLDELAAQNDVILGEMDVERGIAAVAVTFPESGVVFFDVSRPARPRFLSWYRGSKCEEVVIDVNCGAFVDLSDDGKVAFLSVQSLSVVPGGGADPGVNPASTPGIEVIDIRNPRQPEVTDTYFVFSQGGVHTARSHIIRRGKSTPRAPGEYVFSIANGVGVEITRVVRDGGTPRLEPVNLIELEQVHDTFIQEDRLSGRTYLYVAPEFESGFYVYDVTAPMQPRLLAEWDLTPQCSEDWYSHTADVATVRRRRIVTIDAEIVDVGSQSSEDTAEGCGQVIGNADMPGPLWIVDATRLPLLGPARDSVEDDEEALRAASKNALIATWTNPASRAGGDIRFSPHNQQIVKRRGGRIRIYLSHYHGGIYVLDGTAAFRGRRVRPRELGLYVPHSRPGRPDYIQQTRPVSPFFGDFGEDRPTIWDAVYFRGHVFAADARGGFYSLRYRGDRRRKR